MRKFGVVLTVALVIGAALFVFAGAAYAQGGPGGRSGGMWGGNTGPMGRGGHMMGGGMMGGNYGPQAQMPGFGRGGMMGGFGFGAGPMVDEIAGALGIEADDLYAALQEGKTVAEIAEEQGVELQAIADVLTAAHAERLAEAVEAGTLVQEQADLWLGQANEAMLEHLTEGTTAGAFGGMWGRGFGAEVPAGGFGGRMMGGFGFGPGAGMTTVFETLGLEQADFFAALQEGKTVAEIAEEQGVELQTVINAMVAEHAQQIAAAVEAGRLTEEEAGEWLALMTENMTEHFTEGMPMFGGAAGGFGPGMMGHGFNGPRGHMGGGRW